MCADFESQRECEGSDEDAKWRTLMSMGSARCKAKECF